MKLIDPLAAAQYLGGAVPVHFCIGLYSLLVLLNMQLPSAYALFSAHAYAILTSLLIFTCVDKQSFTKVALEKSSFGVYILAIIFLEFQDNHDLTH